MCKVKIKEIENEPNKILKRDFEFEIEELSASVESSLIFKSLGEFIEVKGNVKGKIDLECDICLTPFVQDLDFDVNDNLQASTCVELAEHPNIIAVKEASGNLQQIMEILRDKPSDFDVLSGDDGITQPMMALGAKGVISVAANGYPELFCKMVKSMMTHDNETALSLHYKILKMNNLIFADGNPAGIKCLMAYRNLCKNVLRLPLVPANEVVKKNIENECEIIYNK